MPRVASRLWLRPDPELIEIYAQNHLHPFPRLYELIREVGIRHYTIWLDGADLLLTREGDTPLRGETLELDDPIQQRWVETMTPLFDRERLRDGAGRPDEVFALDPDAEPGPAQMAYRAGLLEGNADDMAAAWRTASDTVREALRAAGVRREWTWVEAGDAWTFRECADLDATEAELAAAPAYQAWTAIIARSYDERTRLEGPRRTREVFRCD